MPKTGPNGKEEGPVASDASSEVKESRWDRRRKRRTEEIMEVAMGVVMAEGLTACSLHRIARELDIAVAGLYRYFPSKMALVAALEIRVIAELSEAMEEARGSLGASVDLTGKPLALAGLLSEGESYRRYAIEAPSRFALISQILADPNVLLPAPLGGQVLTNMMGLLAGVARSFAQAADVGAVAPGDSVERSILFWNGLRAILQMKKLEQHSQWVDADRLFRSMLTTLLVGWGADPEQLQVAAEALAKS